GAQRSVGVDLADLAPRSDAKPDRTMRERFLNVKRHSPARFCKNYVTRSMDRDAPRSVARFDGRHGAPVLRIDHRDIVRQAVRFAVSSTLTLPATSHVTNARSLFFAKVTPRGLVSTKTFATTCFACASMIVIVLLVSPVT